MYIFSMIYFHQLFRTSTVLTIFLGRLQKFKITIANTVISQDNASLQTMGTDQLLDLFELDDKKKGQSSTPIVSQSDNKKETTKSILEGLGELWDKSQYESEYDIGAFMTSLAK